MDDTQIHGITWTKLTSIYFEEDTGPNRGHNTWFQSYNDQWQLQPNSILGTQTVGKTMQKSDNTDF